MCDHCQCQWSISAKLKWRLSMCTVDACSVLLSLVCLHMTKRFRDTPVADVLADIRRDGLLGDALYWIFGHARMTWDSWFHRVFQQSYGVQFGSTKIIDRYCLLAKSLILASPDRGTKRFVCDRRVHSATMTIYKKDDQKRDVFVKLDTPVDWNREKVEAILEPLMSPPTMGSIDLIRELVDEIGFTRNSKRLQCFLLLAEHVITLHAAGYDDIDVVLENDIRAERKDDDPDDLHQYELRFGKYTIGYDSYRGVRLGLLHTGFYLASWNRIGDEMDILDTIRRYEADIPDLKILRDDLERPKKEKKKWQRAFDATHWTLSKKDGFAWIIDEDPVDAPARKCKMNLVKATPATWRLSIQFKRHTWGPYLTKSIPIRMGAGNGGVEYKLEFPDAGLALLDAMGITEGPT